MAKDKNEMSSNSTTNVETLDTHTKEALELLFVKEQETYDEFLAGFSHLNREPISSSIQHLINGHANDAVNSDSSDVTEYDVDLPHELLDASDYMESNIQRPYRSNLMMDNFVEDEQFLLGFGDDTVYKPSILEQSFQQIEYEKSQSSTCEMVTNMNVIDEIDVSLKERITLPGETEIYDSKNAETKLRYLDISTKRDIKNENLSKDVLQEYPKDGQVMSNGRCEVVPFSMDDNFDYDNIILRTKFDVEK
ncbi:uncharacterized protein LOC114542838 [Dendronephthya gigantea]|uniref:uncharacterized protein LOC114542838 n=1 Tax=Dendronephthya gigantea TaxID=151771 RepID=UPI00106BC89A|nr:uncharacterized protein LOC114542838 [Dendronephthya gigantea]